jgi:DNA polymerase-3 subunit epsilon
MADDERKQWDIIAQALEETGEYHIIRRLHQVDRYAEPDGEPTQLGLILDTETTGLDPQADDVIELGMVLFEYAPATGRIYHIVDTFDQLQDPGRPLPAEITALTHITDEMVRGRHIDAAAVEVFVARAKLVIAHNAAFDRPFVERQWKVFEIKPWADSMSQVHWYDEGVATQKQELIALCLGFFYEAHRASNDCLALLHILSNTLPNSGQPALKPLLDHAMVDDARIWAIGAPFAAKDVLKTRGYRFNSGTNGKPKAWYKTVPADEQEQELVFLDSVYDGNTRDKVRVDKMSPLERFSARV